ncbi:peptidase S41 [candidate division KSB1 bacterium]|nr:peptidase S41 [candidate division KSB1 bacterium]
MFIRSCNSGYRFIFLIAILFTTLLDAKTNPLMRFPDIHQDTIIFVSGNDLWKVSTNGGEAIRLTLDDGDEESPHFSPDGKSIAFSGEYDGNQDVYVMTPDGGNITRVTFHPSRDNVVGWHPTKNKILFSSTRDSYSRFSRLYLISPDGTELEPLILHEAAQGSFSPDAQFIAYNRLAREHRTWKRYQGGMAQDIYLYDFASGKDRRMTEFQGTDRIPMWIKDKIYFSSDRTGRLNLYVLSPEDGAIEQLTDHKTYDVRFPNSDDSQIVYENGGNIWLFDTVSGKNDQVDIRVKADAPERRPRWENVKSLITDISPSPSGRQVLVSARGEIFTVPVEHGATLNRTQTSGSREKDAVWSPDGSKAAYFSDASGEYEIIIMDMINDTPPVQLTELGPGYRHTLRWSPDGQKLAFTDQTLTCYIIDVKSRYIRTVDKAEFENIDVSLENKPISDFSWSPDSRFLAYSKMNKDLLYQVYIYDLENERVHQASDGLFNDFNPVFAQNGKHLFFISNRRFDPTLGDFEWEMVYKNVAGIYALTLQKDGDALFPLQQEPILENKDTTDIEVSEIPIDFEGLSSRIESFPLDPGNYRDLRPGKEHLFYLNAEKGDFNRFEFRAHPPMDVYSFSFKERKETLQVKEVKTFQLISDGKALIYRNSEVGIKAIGNPESNVNILDFKNLNMWLDPIAEWNQIFHEAWRMERDFYYEANMHGLDWEKTKERYLSLLHRVTCRQDLEFVIGELIGELNTSHTYVYGGDQHRQATPINVALLGADWQADKDSQRYRLQKIYGVSDWTQDIHPPLAQPGIQVKEGDYLIAVNDTEVTTQKNLYSYFQNLGDQQLKITVNSVPESTGAKHFWIKPVTSDYVLRYLDWVESNRRYVDKVSEGTIGYIHLPDTYLGSAREFPKMFFAQIRKQGLIIDGRYNGGGLDPDIFLRRLDREPLSYWTRRYSHDQTGPVYAPLAHKVCLTNRQAGSGGDELPYLFQKRGMGPVIGTRTWGGLVGVSMFIKLIDGGGLTAPDYRIYDEEGNWVVENTGVTPDILVDNDPAEVAKGIDTQLETAIRILQEKIAKDPPTWPDHHDFPIDENANIE